MDKKIRFSGWQGDAVIRLFRRDLCKYQDLKVHAEIETTGKIGKLKGKIRHYTYKNLPTTLIKTEQYSTWKAYDKLDKVKKITAFHLFIKPVWKFVYHYFIKLGILDGRQGFIISVFSSFNVFLRAVKIWRLHKGEKLKKNL